DAPPGVGPLASADARSPPPAVPPPGGWWLGRCPGSRGPPNERLTRPLCLVTISSSLPPPLATGGFSVHAAASAGPASPTSRAPAPHPTPQPPPRGGHPHARRSFRVGCGGQPGHPRAVDDDLRTVGLRHGHRLRRSR